MNRFLSAALFTAILPAILATGHTRDTLNLFESTDFPTPSVSADTTELPLPLSPVDTVLESSTVTLSWTITRDSAYFVEIRGGITDSLVTEAYEVTLELETGAYEWRVRGLDSAGPGEASDWVAFGVREPLPIPTPISPIDETLTAGEIEFVWSGDWTGETEWRIEGDSSWSVMTTDTMLVASVDSGSWNWQVRAVEDGSPGAWSEPAPLTIVPVADLPVVTPLAPLNKTVGTGLIRLVWISDWRKTFEIQMRGDTTFTASVAAYKLEVQLDNEGTYEWRIRAVEGASLGPWSAWWTFSTSDDITGVEERSSSAPLLDLW